GHAGPRGPDLQVRVGLARDAQQLVTRFEPLHGHGQAHAARRAGDDGEVSGHAAITIGNSARSPSAPATKGTVTAARAWGLSPRQSPSRSLCASPATYICVVRSSRESSFTLKWMCGVRPV